MSGSPVALRVDRPAAGLRPAAQSAAPRTPTRPSVRLCVLCASVLIFVRRIGLLQLRVGILVESKGDRRPLDQDRPADQVGVFHHQIDGLVLRFGQRPFLEDGAPRAHEVEKPLAVDVLLEEGPVRGGLVDVDLLDVDLLLVQETPGVLAGGSGGFGVEGRFRHPEIVR